MGKIVLFEYDTPFTFGGCIECISKIHTTTEQPVLFVNFPVGTVEYRLIFGRVCYIAGKKQHC
jgi:hypothetical protein